MRFKTVWSAVLVGLFTGCQDGCKCDPTSSTDCEVVAERGPALVISLRSGNDQSGPAGSALPAPLVVHVRDATFADAAGVGVTFTVTVGDGDLGSGQTLVSVTTDADGLASQPLRLGATPGSNEVSARITTIPAKYSSGSGEPIIFTAVGLGAAVALEVQAGNDQSGVVGQPLGTAPAALVRDAAGNPVAGVTVDFVLGVGTGGQVDGAVQVSNTDGVVRVDRWILGPTAGPQQLSAAARIPGVTPAVFTATGLADAPETLTKVAGDGQTADPSANVPIPPVVQLADQYGNPVPGVAVHFEFGPSGGIVNADQQTDGQGRAAPTAWQLGATPGSYTLTATAAGTGIAGNPATFTATATPPFGPPVAMAIHAGDMQTVEVGQPVPIPPAVRVTDAQDRPVAGVVISFRLGQPQFGTLTGVTATTDANGVATLGGWTLGTGAGTQYIHADRPSGSAIQPPFVSFQIAATPAEADVLVKVAGDNQIGLVSQPLPIAPVVEVRDVYGNPVPGVPVNFVVTGGAGELNGSSKITDAQGQARPDSWILGSTPGTANNTLAATVPPPLGSVMTTSSVSFIASAVPSGISRPVAPRSP